jgi:ATP-binding cassette subfamily B protein
MMGLIKPDKGNVFYENQNIRHMDEKWMRKIGYVSQKVFLFDDTIKKNICLNFDDNKIDDKKLEIAIDIAELKNKIDSLKNKLDENVGPDGSKLSGGERQRIALARAIYKKTDILFLDEFTSNLDLETEEKIMSKIKNNLPNTTVVMISHRLEIANKSDIIIKIDQK